jgi:PAS domain S-box-containing protein
MHVLIAATIEHLPNAALLVNGNGTIIQANRAAEELFLTPSGGLHNLPLSELIPPDYRSHHNQTVQKYMADPKHRPEGTGKTFWALRSDKSIFPADVILGPIKDGDETAVLAIVRDISALHDARTNLEQARDAAESANRIKSEFLANMSHEIRTPMSGILGMAQLLEQEELSQGQREYVAAIISSATGLLGVLNDILDLSRIEAGKLDLVTIPFSPLMLAQELIMTLKPEAEKKGLTLSCEMSSDLPACVRGDGLRVRQVLINLLSNAIKFTDQGSVTLTLLHRTESEARFTICLTVSDTGPGITSDMMQRMFKPFEQADNSIARRFGGAGLGLSICKKLVELMQGSIHVDSQLGRGSHFMVELPFETSCGCTQTNKPAEEPEQSQLPPLAVLLAEDSAVNRIYMNKLLSRMGHRVTEVVDGTAAIAAWQQQQFDLVLMDIQMPGVDGIAALTAIRQLEAADQRHTPVIALTAHVMEGDREKLLLAGFDGYAAKPVTVDALIAEIRNCITNN